MAFAVIDEEDREAVMARRWHLHATGYARTSVHRSCHVYLHNFLLGPTPPGMEVDHEDENKLNNRRSNLRVIPAAGNRQNRAMIVSNTSGYRGVRQRGRKFVAECRLAGHKYHIGTFETSVEADEAAREFRALHMPFAREAR